MVQIITMTIKAISFFMNYLVKIFIFFFVLCCSSLAFSEEKPTRDSMMEFAKPYSTVTALISAVTWSEGSPERYLEYIDVDLFYKTSKANGKLRSGCDVDLFRSALKSTVKTLKQSKHPVSFYTTEMQTNKYMIREDIDRHRNAIVKMTQINKSDKRNDSVVKSMEFSLKVANSGSKGKVGTDTTFLFFKRGFLPLFFCAM